MTESQLDQISVPNEAWPWPFGLSDLTFGLRRYFNDTCVIVLRIDKLSLPDRRPSIGRVRGIQVDYKLGDQEHSCELVVKEPQGTTRTGLAGAGKREIGLYESLAEHLPVHTPQMLAGSPLGDWLILELIDQGKDPLTWDAADYCKAVDQLSALHDRFWALDVDLGTFPWLGHPLTADFDVYITAAEQGLKRIRESGRPEAFAQQIDRMDLFERLISLADRIVEPLQKETRTLLHGDYWPGNIAALEGGDQIVYDWQLAGVGPGVMDLLAFVYKSLWWFEELPIAPEELIQRYREKIAEKTGTNWNQADWSVLWDHALMWRFVQEWIDLLAVTPEPLLETWADRLEHVWFDPVRHAAERRLET
jgi:hypothetical protein